AIVRLFVHFCIDRNEPKNNLRTGNGRKPTAKLSLGDFSLPILKDPTIPLKRFGTERTYKIKTKFFFSFSEKFLGRCGTHFFQKGVPR
ncbi:MAG: hypothetical protein IIX75_03935, partial [Clostridia bacterium]|nr:hypothetical protein [Clostridia bacterium]